MISKEKKQKVVDDKIASPQQLLLFFINLFLLCTNGKNWLKLTVIKLHGQCTKIETFQGKTFFHDHRFIILSVLWPQVEKCNFFVQLC